VQYPGVNFDLHKPHNLLKPETRSVGTQDDLRYHIGSVDLKANSMELPLLTVLSHTRGQVTAQTFYDQLSITRPGKPDDKGNFTDPAVHLGQIRKDDFWPDYNGPVNCVISEVYEPNPTLITVTEEDDTYKPPPGEEVQPVKWVSNAEEAAAGLLPTRDYTASKLIQQLDYLLDQRDGEAAGPEGYHDTLKGDLQAKFPGQFDLPISH